MTYEMRGEARIHIDKTPEEIYDLVSDVTRMGEWSPECKGAEWAEDTTGPEVGAQFHGTNARSSNEWVTPNTILVADRGKEFAWVVGTADFQVCRWRFAFTPADRGTDVTESFELGHEKVGFLSSVLELPEEERGPMIDARRAQLIEDMQHTLQSLKACAESS